MSKWILKWPSPRGGGPSYVLGFNVIGVPLWSSKQRDAKRYGTRKLARKDAATWLSELRPVVVRLVPKVPS